MTAIIVEATRRNLLRGVLLTAGTTYYVVFFILGLLLLIQDAGIRCFGGVVNDRLSPSTGLRSRRLQAHEEAASYANFFIHDAGNHDYAKIRGLTADEGQGLLYVVTASFCNGLSANTVFYEGQVVQICICATGYPTVGITRVRSMTYTAADSVSQVAVDDAGVVGFLTNVVGPYTDNDDTESCILVETLPAQMFYVGKTAIEATVTGRVVLGFDNHEEQEEHFQLNLVLLANGSGGRYHYGDGGKEKSGNTIKFMLLIGGLVCAFFFVCWLFKRNTTQDDDSVIPNERRTHATQTWIRELVNENPVLLLSVSTCPSCNNAKAILRNAKYRVVELDHDPNGKVIRAELRVFGIESVPAIWIGGQYIGGYDTGPKGGVKTLKGTGELVKMLKRVGAIEITREFLVKRMQQGVSHLEV